MEKQAQKAERDAAKKIEESQKRVREAQNESAHSIDNIKDEFVRQSTAEEVRQQQIMDREKDQYDSAIHELGMRSNEELRKLRYEGDRDVKKTKNFYEDSIEVTKKQADEKLEGIRSQSNAMSAYEQMRAKNEMDLYKQSNEQRTESLRTDLDEQFEKTSAQMQANQENRLNNTVLADEQREDSYKQTFEGKIKKQAEILKNIGSRAARALNQIQQDTAQKISAYGTRQNDPFYQLMTIGANLSENEDAYVLIATIPTHEQKNISITMQGNRLMVKGARQNEEVTQNDPEKTVSSSSYQSYHESFTLDYQVDSKRMTKVFDGDQLIVTIPKTGKLGAPLHRSPYQATAITEKARFPENLPKPTPTQTSAPGEGPVTPG